MQQRNLTGDVITLDPALCHSCVVRLVEQIKVATRVVSGASSGKEGIDRDAPRQGGTQGWLLDKTLARNVNASWQLSVVAARPQ
jgi:hypothetical protein